MAEQRPLVDRIQTQAESIQRMRTTSHAAIQRRDLLPSLTAIAQRALESSDRENALIVQAYGHIPAVAAAFQETERGGQERMRTSKMVVRENTKEEQIVLLQDKMERNQLGQSETRLRMFAILVVILVGCFVVDVIVRQPFTTPSQNPLLLPELPPASLQPDAESCLKALDTQLHATTNSTHDDAATLSRHGPIISSLLLSPPSFVANLSASLLDLEIFTAPSDLAATATRDLVAISSHASTLQRILDIASFYRLVPREGRPGTRMASVLARHGQDMRVWRRRVSRGKEQIRAQLQEAQRNLWMAMMLYLPMEAAEDPKALALQRLSTAAVLAYWQLEGGITVLQRELDRLVPSGPTEELDDESEREHNAWVENVLLAVSASQLREWADQARRRDRAQRKMDWL